VSPSGTSNDFAGAPDALVHADRVKSVRKPHDFVRWAFCLLHDVVAEVRIVFAIEKDKSRLLMFEKPQSRDSCA